jgi:peptidoglycan hydrolase CwlO-like protein
MKRPVFLFLTLVALISAAAFIPRLALGQATTTTSTIAALQAEINTYQAQITNLGTQKTTLQSTINGLTLSQKELAAQIKLTQAQIAAANTSITGLTSSIADKQESIGASQDAIASALRTIAQDEDASLVTQIISSNSLQEAWQDADVTFQFDRALEANIDQLNGAQVVLTQNRDQVSATKTNLVALQTQLNTQNKSIAENKAQQQQLLAQTKDSQVVFEKLLASAKAQLASFSAFTTAAGGSGILTNQTVCDSWGCYYNQRDSEWGNVPLSGTSDRMAADGCLVTSMAMVLTHYGFADVNPLTINSNPANFSAVGGLLLFTTYFDNTSASRVTAAIDPILATGNPVIVGLHAYGGTHFVVLVSGSKGSYIMRDPYIPNGKDISFTAHYKLSSIYAVNKVIVTS